MLKITVQVNFKMALKLLFANFERKLKNIIIENIVQHYSWFTQLTSNTKWETSPNFIFDFQIWPWSSVLRKNKNLFKFESLYIYFKIE